ncbi:hypothetical protein D3C78_1859410 [compost metagenome]
MDIQPFKPWWPDSLQAAGADLPDTPGAKPRAAPAAKAVQRTPGAVITGPDTVAVDLSDKLPWED